MQPASGVSAHSCQPSNERLKTAKILPFSQAQSQDRVFGEELERVRSAQRPQGQLEQSLEQPIHFGYAPGLYDKDQPSYLYPYGISRYQLETVIRELNLPVVLTKDMDSADAILALRSHARKHSNLERMAQDHQVPIYTMKANTITQITRTLQQVLGIEEPSTNDDKKHSRFVRRGSEDDIDALEEARLAVEEIVIPKGQPVELLPRSSKVRAMQHELVERYNLKSHSFGEEPNRRLRIYPA
jgi:hypothetical protein